MLYHASTVLLQTITKLVQLKDNVLTQWLSDEDVIKVLQGHNISAEAFKNKYASGVFDFFIDVLEAKIEAGDCPAIGSFLIYLKDREVNVEELFVICSHFRQAMIDNAVTLSNEPIILSKELSCVFDKNFRGVLKRYTDTIFQKNQEIAKNEKLLLEYKRAIDESAIVSKTDTKGLITFVNDNFIKRCGYTKEELIGTRHGIVWDENECMELFRRIDKKLSKGEVFHDTVKNSKKSGEDYYVDMTMLPIYDYKGNVIEYMEISYEVTTLIKVTREAIAANKAKEYFLSNMSHEIRTPLNAILGFVSLLESEELSKRHKQYLNIIHNSGENLLSIMNDILDFSKLQSGEFMIEPQAFNIHEELSKTLELFVSSANEKQITLLSYFDPGISHILIADILRIKQIVSNFISNAIKFSKSSSIIEIYVSYENSYLSISVKDWGVGLDKSDISRIFDPFSQVKSDVQQLVAGTGLGLSICKKLAENMNGEVIVKSKKGEGSTFILKIPVEIQESSLSNLFDPEPFREIKTGVIRLSNSESKILKSLEYYFKYFDFEYNIITPDKIKNYNLILFLDNEMDKEILNQLKLKNVPMIAIMQHLSNKYDNEDLITPLFFPFYCAKIYNAFAEAIGANCVEKDLQIKSQRRFRGKVLVAEDNKANQELIKVLLKRYSIDFIMVSNGKEAIEKFKDTVFDLVLMDEQMPIKTGTEATKEILIYEKQHHQKHTPIINLTANVLKGAKEKGLKSGYDAFLGKPVVIKDLEYIFETYLDEIDSTTLKIIHENVIDNLDGIDFTNLQNELQLNIDELKLLLDVYIKKMNSILPLLLENIETKNLKQIRSLAHNIKGSSANFRFDEIQRIAKVIEDSAAKKDIDFEYLEAFNLLEDEYKKVLISV